MQVGLAEFKVPVVPRKTVYETIVSDRRLAAWPAGERWSTRELFVSPGGREVTVVSSRSVEVGERVGADKFRLRRWEVAGGQARQVLDVSLDEGLGLDADRQRLLARKLRFMYWNSMATVSEAKFSADGRWLAVAARNPDELREARDGHRVETWTGRLALVDAMTGEVVRQFEADGVPHHGLCFSPDGLTVAAVRSSGARQDADIPVEKRIGEVRLWEISTGRPQATVRLAPGENARQVVFSPDGKLLAVLYSSASPAGGPRRDMVKLWNLAQAKVVAILADRSDARFAGVGRWLVAQSRRDKGGQVRIYDLETKEDRVLYRYDLPKEVPYGASAWMHLLTSSDNGYASCCFHDGRVVVVELATGKVLAQQEATVKTRSFYNGWALSGDGRLLVGSVNAWPPYRVGGNLLEDWQEVPPAEFHVWDAARLRRLATLTGHIGGFNRLTLAAGGEWLVSAGGRPEEANAMLRLWDLRDIAKDPGTYPLEPSLKVAKYDGMLGAIQAQRGKVVVVDFWTDTCVPCKKEFPRLVRLQTEYAAGLAAISVSLDDAQDEAARDSAVRFLRAKKASFTNLILDESPELWQKKLAFVGPPAVLVFDREGRLSREFKDGVNYDDVEKLVRELMGK
jgi:thiol-disulfide isomerase/thioredoxin